MFKFTSLFCENLIAESTNSLFSLNGLGTLGSSGSFLPTSTTLSATETSGLGTRVINSGDNDNNFLEMTLGSVTTSAGTSISIHGNRVYQETIQQLETTQAYIESLDGEELEELIAKLELKDIELSLQESEKIKSL